MINDLKVKIALGYQLNEHVDIEINLHTRKLIGRNTSHPQD